MHPPRRVFDAGWLIVEWPERYAHWHVAVQPALAELEAGMLQQLEPWRREAGPPPRLIVCRDPGDAALELAARGLRADPRVPRTFPALRLAIVPLALDDSVLAALPVPPTTWRSSLLHEAAHLQIALRPDLAPAPLWFHEGLAESWSGAIGSWQQHGVWPIPEPGSQPSERLLRAWAYWAQCALREDDSLRPWQFAETLAESAGRALAEEDGRSSMHAGLPAETRWRGRDAHVEEGLVMAIPLPQQIVEVDLPALAPGESVTYELRTGATGIPDAGLRLDCRDGGVIRLRCDSYGGLAAWAQRAEEPPRSQGTDRVGESVWGGTPRSARIEHRGAELAILASNGFLFRHPLPASARDYPVEIVLYARGGLFSARRLP